ncbi:DUF871 domain-containing protein [Bacillus sp. V3-13]|uniref:DUF871 domain-containing protein n=1 Tax=Bacillus sp. V3-13 TaxID=2053728 RepID=UPI000C757458|nr:MupG family TIM beta-alpha barrel fold protein [Bacillus sp. V3-13]PLR78160.1 DUF871 domain-containing protein [Bacillus sp. V3-13]
MIGISVYLTENKREQNRIWIKKASSCGLKSIFTSLHIPEDDHARYKDLLMELGSLAKEHDMELLADVSPLSLSYLGLTWENIGQLTDWGLTGIRADYGFSAEQIVQLSALMKVGMNASTVSHAELDKWISMGLNVNNVEAWHNFYPRPETGLDSRFLSERNQFLKSKGLTTMAFVPGNLELRGPVFAGLPTVEEHRHASPAASAAELLYSLNTDKVLIGDYSVTESTLQQLSSLANGVIPLKMKPVDQNGSLPILKEIHTNRMDPARDVIRSVESRSYAQTGNGQIRPANQFERRKGAITLDNQLYGRYSGELQVTLTDLPKDERVNVIGYVKDEDIPLLKQIRAGGKFTFIVRG